MDSKKSLSQHKKSFLDKFEHTSDNMYIFVSIITEQRSGSVEGDYLRVRGGSAKGGEKQ
jgi:hypothetical protein